MLDTARCVLIRYRRDGEWQRGSGLRVGGSYVLTAFHCARGDEHEVHVDHIRYVARVHAVGNSDVDVAVLEVPDLPPVARLRCARVDRTVVARVPGCVAVGFPFWKGGTVAQVAGYIPTSEGLNPRAGGTDAALLSLKIDDPAVEEFPVPEGAADDRETALSVWGGMSGAVVVGSDDAVLGVVRSHVLSEGGQSLTVTPLAAIDTLPAGEAAELWSALHVPSLHGLPFADTNADVAAGNRPVNHRSIAGLLLDGRQFKELNRILQGCRAPRSLRRDYQEATLRLADILPPNRDDLGDCIAQLRRLTDATPLYDFLVRFAATQADGERQDLEDWMQDTAGDYGVDLVQFDELRGELRRVVVLIRLDPALAPAADPASWQVTAWRYRQDGGTVIAADDAAWDRAALAGLIEQEFANWVSDFDPRYGTEQFAVEFLIGLDAVDSALEELEITVAGERRVLGTVCPVSVRAQQRLDEDTDETHDAWEANWRQLQSAGDAYDANVIAWIGSGAARDVHLHDAGIRRLCAALAYDHGSDRSSVLRGEFAAGTPVALWHRAVARHPSRRQALEGILGNRGLLDLPAVVMRQRIQARRAADDPAHRGRDIVLMWDDPERVPVEADWQSPDVEGVL